MTLATASASILESPEVEDVLAATMQLARDVFAADGYALWRYDAPVAWHIVRSLGVSDAFGARVIAVNSGRPVSNEVEFAHPLLVEDVAAAPMIAEMQEAYRQEGIASLIMFPLRIGGIRSGTLVFYFRHPRTFQTLDVQVGTALASVASAAIANAELYAEQRAGREAADYARQQATFLADAGTLLGASLDYQHTLSAVAKLAVPTFAD